MKQPQQFLLNVLTYLLINFPVILVVGLALAIASGCANKPSVMKQARDCVKVKGQKIASLYLCLDVGGDAKDRIP